MLLTQVVTPDWYLGKTSKVTDPELYLLGKELWINFPAGGPRAPGVGRCEGGESQYATGIHNPTSPALWHISPVKHCWQFLNAAEVLMLVFIKDAQQDNRVRPVLD